MLKIEELTQEQLIQKATLEGISGQVKNCIGLNTKANTLASRLEKKITETRLETAAPKVYKIYQYWIRLLQFEALELYSNTKVLELIEKHCLEGLMFSPNIFRSLSVKLAIIPLHLEDAFLKDIRDALKRNTQRIGTKDIMLAREARAQPPTVGNWLLDYDDVLGIEYHEDVERSTYFIRSRNVKDLTERDKEILRRLFYFYDLLKLDTTQLGGLASFSPATMGLEEEKEKPLKRFEPLFDPLELLEEKPPPPPKPAVVPPVAPPKPPVEIEKEMKPKVTPPAPPKPEIKPIPEFRPSEVPKPKPPVSPKIKPAPEFKPAPPRPQRPPRIAAAPPPPPKPVLPSKPKVPVKIESIDDIKKLTTSDFRGYAEVPRDSARAIIDKINSILTSPLDKLKALSFWKESDLYKLYIEMGRESMAQEKSVKELAEERRAQGKPHLTHEEFEAIAEISGAIG